MSRSPVNHAGAQHAAVHLGGGLTPIHCCASPLRGDTGLAGTKQPDLATRARLERLAVHLHVSSCACVFVLAGAKEDFAALRNFVLAGDGSMRGVLRFPEICTMQLHLLSAGSPDLEVLSHVFHGLLAAVHASQRNAALLYDQVSCRTLMSLILMILISNVSLGFTDFMHWSFQGGVKTILSGFQSILSHTDPSFTGLFLPTCLTWFLQD